MLFSKVVALFKSGNVCVCGLRGTGKDVLTGNVIARRKKPYVSNLNYTNDNTYQFLEFDKIDCGGNSYLDLLSGDVKYYEYPYSSGSDIYISDAGIYLPSQYCNELNKQFKYLPMFFALSRQVAHCNVHINVQALQRLWDKCREQSDIYIRCRRCIVLFGGHLVLQSITLYDKYQSCVDRVKPCQITVPIMASREVKENARMYLDKFRNTYGTIQNRFLIYVNKSKHDTYYFEKLFRRGKKHNV